MTAGERRPRDDVELVPRHVVGSKVGENDEVVVDVVRSLAGDPVDEVHGDVADAGGAEPAHGRRRIGGRPPAERRPHPRQEALDTERDAHIPSGRPHGERLVGLVGVGLDRHLGVRRELCRERLVQALEAPDAEQRRRTTAEVESPDAVDLVRRPFQFPLRRDGIHEPVERRAGGRLRRLRRAALGAPQRHDLGVEVAVVTTGGAERDVHVDVPHGTGEGVTWLHGPIIATTHGGVRVSATGRRRPTRARRGRPPAAPRRRRAASCASCPPSASRAACACA